MLRMYWLNENDTYRPVLALFAISPRCNGASAVKGRPSVAGKPSSRQPVTQLGHSAQMRKTRSNVELPEPAINMRQHLKQFALPFSDQLSNQAWL